MKVVDSSMMTSMAGVAEAQAEDKKKTLVVVVLLETQSMKAGAVHRSVMVEVASHPNARAEVPAGARAKESSPCCCIVGGAEGCDPAGPEGGALVLLLLLLLRVPPFIGGGPG